MAELRTARRSTGGGNGNNKQPGRVYNASGNPKMQIIAEGGKTFTVPYAPREGTLTGVAPVFDNIGRGGRSPLLLRSGDSLEEYSFELIVAYPDPQQSVEDELEKLRDMAESGKRMAVRLNPTTARKQWRITGFSQQTIGLVHGTNDASRALVSLTLTQASDAAVNVGPLSGGKGGDGDKDRPKFYTFKKGDTLQEIAKRFYGKASAWQKIADANKIRDPKKIKVGTKLRLP